MIVKPHIGIGPLRLGMTRETVVGTLGKPDEIEQDEWPDGLGESWEYEESGLDLMFHEVEDWRLGSITTSSSSTVLAGILPVGMDEANAVNLLRSAGTPTCEMDEYFEEWQMRMYDFDDWGVSVWAAHGVVDAISVIPRYNEDDEPIWPDPDQTES